IPIGCLSESAIVDALGDEGLQKKNLKTVKDFIEPCAPLIPPDTDIETVVHILQQHHSVFVVDKAKVVGVISKRDLLPLIH
ncbi:MAG TPA: CBS domain-containing protein, partial [Methanomicrobiales archaeon]|nr:CBS domain-containing protein [Methanomicrobiales archaeon]